MRLRLPLIAVTLAAALTLSACGGSSGGSDSSGGGGSTTEAPSSGAGEAGGTDVTIADFAFDPDELEVKVGDTVTFANEDDAEHTATSDEGDPKSFDTGKLGNGDSKDVTFDEAGDYAYYCSIHDYMKGTVRVVE